MKIPKSTPKRPLPALKSKSGDILTQNNPNLRQWKSFGHKIFGIVNVAQDANGTPWFIAKEIAEALGKEHHDVIKSFDKAIAEGLTLTKDGEEPFFKHKLESYIDSMNREQTTYIVNLPLFLYVVLGFSGKKTIAMRHSIISLMTHSLDFGGGLPFCQQFC